MSQKLIDMETSSEQSPNWRTVDDGRAIEFDEGLWENAEFVEFVQGYEIFTKNRL